MARILVVDDEADMRLALHNVLLQNGHAVEQAGDGMAALARAAKGGLDLVLLDMRLPGLDGKQILRRLKEQDAALPVIMVSGYGSVDSAVEVLKLGASHYLAKPFSNKELVETVERVLASSASAGGPQPEEGVLRRRLAEKAAGTTVQVRSAQAGPSSRPVAKVVVSACLAMAVVLALWSARRNSGEAYTLPSNHPTALVWMGDRLLSADWFTQTVTEHRLKGKSFEFVRSVKLPQSHISGLAAAGERVYLADSWKKVIEVRRLDASLSLIESFPSPGPVPSGLFWDGRYLWSSDASTGRFYQHDPTSGLTVLASYKSPGKTPAGMHKDAQYFWSADADSRALYQHRLDNELRTVARYSLPALDAGNQTLSCFAIRGSDVWLGRDGLSRLVRTPLSSFKKIAP